MSRSKRLCYIKPEFPQDMFVAAILMTKEENVGFVPITFVYRSVTELSKQLEYCDGEFRKKEDGSCIMPLAFVIPLTLDTIIPLKTEYWENPTVAFTRNDLFSSLQKMFRTPAMYRLLITPAGYERKEKKWYFLPALPLGPTATDADIENFMLHSKHPVDERANAAAIYRTGRELVFEWQTGKLTKAPPRDFSNQTAN